MNTMKKIILILCISLVLGAAAAWADDGWEMSLTIGSGMAENRLSFGQRPDATSGRDGRYDVPPMPGGTLNSMFTNGGGSFWRDIRDIRSGETVWQLTVASTSPDAMALLKWNPKAIPAGVSMALRDAQSGISVDMAETNQLAMKLNGNQVLEIVVTR